MKSLAYYNGEPTWWDQHGFIAGLVRTALVIVGISPLLIACFIGVVWPGFLEWFGNPPWHSYAYFLLGPTLGIGWAYIFVGLAIDINL